MGEKGKEPEDSKMMADSSRLDTVQSVGNAVASSSRTVSSGGGGQEETTSEATTPKQKFVTAKEWAERGKNQNKKWSEEFGTTLGGKKKHDDARIDRKGKRGNQLVTDDICKNMEALRGRVDAFNDKVREMEDKKGDEEFARRVAQEEAKLQKAREELEHSFKCSSELRNEVKEGKVFREIIDDEVAHPTRRIIAILFFTLIPVVLVLGLSYFAFCWWYGGFYTFLIKILWTVLHWTGWTVFSVYVLYFVYRAALVVNTRGIFVVWPDWYHTKGSPAWYHKWLVWTYLMVYHWGDKMLPFYVFLVLATWVVVFGFRWRWNWREIEFSVPERTLIMVGNHEDLEDEQPILQKTIWVWNPKKCWVPIPRFQYGTLGGKNWSIPELVITMLPENSLTLLQYLVGCILDLMPFVRPQYYWIHTIKKCSEIRVGPVGPDLRLVSVAHLELSGPEMRITLEIESVKRVEYRVGFSGWKYDMIVVAADGRTLINERVPCLALYSEMATPDLCMVDPNSKLFEERINNKMRASQTINLVKHLALVKKVYQDTYYLVRMIWAENKAQRLLCPFH